MSEILNWYIKKHELPQPRGESWTRGKCPECGNKESFMFSDKKKDFPYKCWSCDLKGFVVNDYRTAHPKERQSDMTEEERLVINYKSESKKTHRLSELSLLNIRVYPYKSRDKSTGLYTGKPYNALTIFEDGEAVKKLIGKTWLWNPGLKTKPTFLGKSKINKKNKQIAITAGEWDYMAWLSNMDIQALALAGGETKKKYNKFDFDILEHKDVIIILDNDGAGRRGALTVKANIIQYAKVSSIRILDMSVFGLTGGGDIDDYFSQDFPRDQLIKKMIDTIASLRPESIPQVIADGGLSYLPDLIVKELKLDIDYSRMCYPPQICDALYSMLGLSAAKQQMFLFTIASEQDGKANLHFLALKRELETIEGFVIIDSIVKMIKVYFILRKKKENDNDLDIFFYYDSKENYYKIFNTETINKLSYRMSKTFKLLSSLSSLSKTKKLINEIFTEEINETPIVNPNNHKGFWNFENGIYDINKGTFKDHTPDVFGRYKLKYNYSESPCPNFEAAVPQWLDDSSDVKEFYKMLYYIISQDRARNYSFILLGDGQNGKGEIFNVLKNLISETYTSNLSLEDLESDFMIATIKDSLLNLCDEVEKNARIKDGVFKRLTGGQRIVINEKFGTIQSIYSLAAWIIAANEPPKLSDNSKGMNRRLIYFRLKSIQDKDIIPNFYEVKLKHELPGIFHLAATKGKKYFLEDNGFKENDSMRAEKEEAAESNSVTAYLRQAFNRFVVNAVDNMREGSQWSWSSSSVIRNKPYIFFINKNGIYFEPIENYEEYRKFCKSYGYYPTNQKTFGNDSGNFLNSWLETNLNGFTAKRIKPITFKIYWDKDHNGLPKKISTRPFYIEHVKKEFEFEFPLWLTGQGGDELETMREELEIPF